ncbi:MAG: MerR family transcriptional regulator [Nitriliruptoraceae bacterium]|nr:MerR family transcriptional regulator [Nitriliruptoraceae bacterium]
MTSFTIGEVLNQLKDEFDDITISKIRFLEAEGLIHPDRTDSGYRKFTGHDVERLRYVLRAQRDRYLPLKVIKDELARVDAGLPALPDEPDTDADGAGSATSTPPLATPSRSLLDPGLTDLQLSGEELAEAAGADAGVLEELRTHGLIGSGPVYDGDDLRIVKTAAQLLDSGLEGRHLRMYRQFADREATLIEALVAPALRQRNPESRRAASDRAERVAVAGNGLHQALLARLLRAALRS